MLRYGKISPQTWFANFVIFISSDFNKKQMEQRLSQVLRLTPPVLTLPSGPPPPPPVPAPPPSSCSSLPPPAPPTAPVQEQSKGGAGGMGRSKSRGPLEPPFPWWGGAAVSGLPRQSIPIGSRLFRGPHFTAAHWRLLWQRTIPDSPIPLVTV